LWRLAICSSEPQAQSVAQHGDDADSGLEERLGARLLNRSTRKVSLTEIGKSYYERCVHILADMDEADNVVHALHLTPRGTLRINASVAVPSLLAPVIAEFTSLYPEVKLSVTMSDRMVDLVEEESTWRFGRHPYRTRASSYGA